MPVAADHELRRVLANEVHARPPAALRAPELISHLSLLVEESDRLREHDALARIGERMGVTVAVPASNHLFVDFGSFRFKWERHTEFTEYTFFRRAGTLAADDTALAAAPQDWIASLPGKTLVAAHAVLADAGAGLPDPDEVRRGFSGPTLLGSSVAGGAASVFTDFRIQANGFSRFLICDRGLREQQAGRLVQCLTDIETYRMAALLAFPLAKDHAGRLREAEERVAALIAELAPNRDPEGAQHESQLLERLTSLAVEVERMVTASRFRFSASHAYYALVTRRIAELREERFSGLQTIGEFMERRLAPALATCEAVARRQEEFAVRIARASELLRTRVDVVREQQNQALLVSMNQRTRLQLRLQQTVEGLSIAAISYYGAGIVAYLAKAISSAGLPLDHDLAAAISIPVIAVAVWFGLRRLRRELVRAEAKQASIDL